MRIVKTKRMFNGEGGWAASTTAIVLALTSVVVGAATTAVSAISAGNAKKASDQFNADVARNNAKASQQQAAADAALIDKRNARLRGTQIAALAAAGIDPNSSTAQDLVYDSNVQGELNRLTTIYKGKVKATDYNTEALGSEFAGKQAQAASYISAGGSILSGAVKAGSAVTTHYGKMNNDPYFE